MPIFSNDQCDMIEKYSEAFSEWLKKQIVVKLQAQIGYKLPSELDSILAKLSDMNKVLKKRNTAGVIKDEHSVPDDFAPLIKRIMIHQRRIVASKLEEPLSKTFHPELIGNLEKELEPVRKMMEAAWFLEATALR